MKNKADDIQNNSDSFLDCHVFKFCNSTKCNYGPSSSGYACNFIKNELCVGTASPFAFLPSGRPPHWDRIYFPWMNRGSRDKIKLAEGIGYWNIWVLNELIEQTFGLSRDEIQSIFDEGQIFETIAIFEGSS